MSTTKELLKAIQEKRAELHEALHDVHAKWETKPVAADGEDAWSPKQVVRHVIGAEWFFTNQIVKACGYPTSEPPEIDVSAPGKAAAALARAGVNTDSMLRHVSQAELSKTAEHPRLGGSLTVEQIMRLIASHAGDHAAQLRAAGR